MSISLGALHANANTSPIEEGRAGTILRIGSDHSGPNKSGLEVITIDYDPDETPAFTARSTDILGSNVVATNDDLDGIFRDALEAADKEFIGNPQV